MRPPLAFLSFLEVVVLIFLVDREQYLAATNLARYRHHCVCRFRERRVVIISPYRLGGGHIGDINHPQPGMSNPGPQLVAEPEGMVQPVLLADPVRFSQPAIC